MRVRVRFFARFRELLGTDIAARPAAGTTVTVLVQEIAGRNPEGYAAIFDGSGAFREFVILMQNGRRLDLAEAATTMVEDGDDIAVFPPVAGG